MLLLRPVHGLVRPEHVAPIIDHATRYSAEHGEHRRLQEYIVI